MIGSQSSPVFALVAIVDLPQIQVMHHVGYKPRQMVFRQPILQTRRQKERLIQRTLAESLAHSGIKSKQRSNIVKYKCSIYFRQAHYSSQNWGQVQPNFSTPISAP